MAPDPDKNDTNAESVPAATSLWSEVRIGAAFLTRLPIHLTEAESVRKLAEVAWVFPFVGAGVGLVAGAALYLGLWLGLDPLAAALLAVGGTVLLTGGLHEDGLADVADGFGGGTDKAEKLRIMGDSAIGTFGVIALIVALGLRTTIVAGMVGPGTAVLALVGAGIGSRAALPILMATLKPAKGSGLGAGAGTPKRSDIVITLLIAAVAMLAILGSIPGIAAFLAAAAAFVAVSGIAQRQIGGFTGDVLGTLQQSTEIAILAAVASATV
jgi:adenosylcobinamide-GDP ribazoletransferase